MKDYRFKGVNFFSCVKWMSNHFYLSHALYHMCTLSVSKVRIDVVYGKNIVSNEILYK